MWTARDFRGALRVSASTAGPRALSFMSPRTSAKVALYLTYVGGINASIFLPPAINGRTRMGLGTATMTTHLDPATAEPSR